MIDQLRPKRDVEHPAEYRRGRSVVTSMTIWTMAAAYVSALISSAVTFAYGYGLAPATAWLLAAATTLASFSVFAAVTFVLRWSKPYRAEWHQARADELRTAQSSCALRWLAVIWALLTLAQAGYVLETGVPWA